MPLSVLIAHQGLSYPGGLVNDMGRRPALGSVWLALYEVAQVSANVE